MLWWGLPCAPGTFCQAPITLRHTCLPIPSSSPASQASSFAITTSSAKAIYRFAISTPLVPTHHTTIHLASIGAATWPTSAASSSTSLVLWEPLENRYRLEQHTFTTSISSADFLSRVGVIISCAGSSPSRRRAAFGWRLGMK